MRVFVTGGSGFIGGHLIERLLAEGHEVIALARSSRAAEVVRERGAEPVRGDLGNVETMREGARGCTHAVHAAAALGEWGRRREPFVRTNVEGTRAVLRACREAGVGRFVHVGTEAALLAGAPLVQVTESAPLRLDSPAHYSATKALAEQEVLAANAEGFETMVVRPRLVYGPGDSTILPSLAAAVRQGRFAWIGSGGQLTDTTHVDNVVEGLVLALLRGRPGGVWFVTDGEPIEFRQFVTDLLATQGIEPGERTISVGLARLLATAGEAIWRMLPLPGQPPVTRLALWLSALETTIDITRAREELGYAPVRTRDEGLARLRAEV